MRTTLDIPEELITEAQAVSGAKTKTLAVSLALQEYIRMKKMRRILDYRGKIKFDTDTKKIRKERDMR